MAVSPGADAVLCWAEQKAIVLAPETTFDEYLANPLEPEEVEVQPIDLSMASMQGGGKGSSSEVNGEVGPSQGSACTGLCHGTHVPGGVGDVRRHVHSGS